MVLPVTSAGAALRAIRKKGKFQGRMPPITPIGCRKRKIVSPGRSLSTNFALNAASPFSHVVDVFRSEGNFNARKGKRLTLFFAMIRAMGSRFGDGFGPQQCAGSFARSIAGSLAQARWADYRGVEMPRSTSAAVLSGTVQRGSPVDGLITSMRLFPSAETNLPLMKLP